MFHNHSTGHIRDSSSIRERGPPWNRVECREGEGLSTAENSVLWVLVGTTVKLSIGMNQSIPMRVHIKLHSYNLMRWANLTRTIEQYTRYRETGISKHSYRRKNTSLPSESSKKHNETPLPQRIETLMHNCPIRMDSRDTRYNQPENTRNDTLHSTL